MTDRLTRLHRDQRGMSFIFVGMGFMAFLAATTLAIDVGMIDDGAEPGTERRGCRRARRRHRAGVRRLRGPSISGPAVRSALTAARANDVVGRQVEVGPEDVEFLMSPDGLDNRVRVTVYPSTGRANSAVPTDMGKYFNVKTVDVVATATAEASPANAMTCVKPFIIPDRWIESGIRRGLRTRRSRSCTQHGNPLPNPDVYIPAGQQGYIGYNQESDRVHA